MAPSEEEPSKGGRAMPVLPPRPQRTAPSAGAASTTTAKVTLGDDTRLIHYPVDEGLAGLRAAVARRWPEEAAPLVLRACPPPAAAASQSHEVAVGPGTPADTVADDEALAAALAPWPALGRVPRLAAVRPGTEGEPEHDAGLLEPWILDFVGLVREHLGIDAEQHLELHAAGGEAFASASAETTPPDAAGPLFDLAISKFRETAAVALFNWGSVHMCSARRRMEPPKPESAALAAAAPAAADADAAAAAAPAKPPAFPPPALGPEALSDVEVLLSAAEARLCDALDVKPDLHDASISRAQQRYERARLLSPFEDRKEEAEALFREADERYRAVLPLLPADDDDGGGGGDAEAGTAAGAAAGAVAAAGAEPGAEPGAEAEAGAEGGGGGAGAAAEASVRSQVRVMHGNVLYDWSGLRLLRRGADEGSWKGLLEDAVALFTLAGCAQADIDGAVAAHAGNAGAAAKAGAGAEGAAAAGKAA